MVKDITHLFEDTSHLFQSPMLYFKYGISAMCEKISKEALTLNFNKFELNVNVINHFILIKLTGGVIMK